MIAASIPLDPAWIMLLAGIVALWGRIEHRFTSIENRIKNVERENRLPVEDRGPEED